MDEKNILIMLFLSILIGFAFSVETGDYRYYTYGQDFNLSEFVVDIDGVLDTDFSSDCNITGKYDLLGTQVFDNNTMLNDDLINGLYYISINGSDTVTWKRGKYSVLMYCQDGNSYGSENISFIIDKDVIQTIEDTNDGLTQKIIDTNSIGKGLNEDQNQILYDLNDSVNSLLDNEYPVITFVDPVDGTESSNNTINFSIDDDSLITDINVYINGVLSSYFDPATDCTLSGTNKSCTYFENGFSVGEWFDINVVAVDYRNNIGSNDSNFFFISPGLVFIGGYPTIPTGQIFEVKNFSDPMFLDYKANKKGSIDLLIKNISIYDVKDLNVYTIPEINGISFVYSDNESFVGANQTKMVKMFYEFDEDFDGTELKIVFDSGYWGAEEEYFGITFFEDTSFLYSLNKWLNTSTMFMGIIWMTWFVLLGSLIIFLVILNFFEGGEIIILQGISILMILFVLIIVFGGII